MTTKQQKRHSLDVVQENRKNTKNDKIAFYVRAMKKADVTKDGKDSSGSETKYVIDFLQTNFPKSAEWKEGVNEQIDKQLKIVDDALKSPLTKCSATALIARCNTDRDKGATDKVATFLAGAYKIDGKAITNTKVITADLKNEKLALDTTGSGTNVKGAVADQDTAKAIVTALGIGQLKIKADGTISTSSSATLQDIVESSSYGSSKCSNSLSSKTIESESSETCEAVVKAAIWNYLNTGKGGTDGKTGVDAPKAGIAGAKAIHDYLDKVVLADKAKFEKEKNINEVADSKIVNAFAEIGKIYKDGNNKCAITTSGTIDAGKTAAESCKTEAKDVKDVYDADATKNTKIANAMEAAHEMAGAKFFTDAIGTGVGATITADTYGKASGENTITKNLPKLSKKVIIEGQQKVVGTDGWEGSPTINANTKIFAQKYDNIAVKLCGVRVGVDLTGYDPEVQACMKSYYHHVTEVLKICDKNKLDDDCATKLANNLMTIYNDDFFEVGSDVPFLNIQHDDL